MSRAPWERDWSLRVLVLAPTGSDAQVASDVLATYEIDTRVCSGIGEICDGLEAGAGAVLLTEEALVVEPPELLVAQLASQPPWSDIPIILLTTKGEEARWSEVMGSLFSASGNLTLVERPCSSATLASAVQVALRARRKQYEARELLIREQQSAAAAKEALAKAQESERAREVLLDSERAARADAEKANRIKDEFLATLSHELRTPLSVIVSWSSMLSRKFGALDEQLRYGLSIVVDNANTQAKLTSELLDMSRIMSGKMTLKAEPTELLSLVSKALDSHRPAAEAKHIVLEWEPQLTSARVLGDPTRLQQVFWNLLSNAIKFTPDGGRVRVSIAASSPERFEVVVADTGEGIAAPFLPEIFDRFRQADGSTSRRHGGLGIGLALVKQLVEMHDGAVTAESAGIGHGATFTVVLPALAKAQPTEVMVPGEPHMADDSLSSLRILAVDDQPHMLEIIRRVLEEYGASVVAVESGSEALQRLRASRLQPFNVLVSDIGMPNLDGYALLKAVRSDLHLSPQALPVIAVTAYARPEDRARLLEAGFQAHLTKPYQVGQLVSTVRRFATIGIHHSSQP